MKASVLVTGTCFNTTSTLENNPYHYAKTLAERAAWDAVRAQDRWTMVTINPGLVLGPSHTAASDSGSLFLMRELMSGYFFYGAPNFSFTFVDVRDVATAHIRAAQSPTASGRYILARPDMVSFAEMARIVRGRYPWRIQQRCAPEGAVATHARPRLCRRQHRLLTGGCLRGRRDSHPSTIRAPAFLLRGRRAALEVASAPCRGHPTPRPHPLDPSDKRSDRYEPVCLPRATTRSG